MKATCRLKCQFRGRSVKPGETFDIKENEIDDRVKNSFTFAEPDPVSVPSLASEPDDPDEQADKADLTIPELKRRLSEMGVPFKARDTRDVLEALYNQAHQPQEIK